MSRTKARFRECPICGCALDPGEVCDCTAPDREDAQAEKTDDSREAREGRERMTA